MSAPHREAEASGTREWDAFRRGYDEGWEDGRASRSTHPNDEHLRDKEWTFKMARREFDATLPAPASEDFAALMARQERERIAYWCAHPEEFTHAAPTPPEADRALREAAEAVVYAVDSPYAGIESVEMAVALIALRAALAPRPTPEDRTDG